METIPALMEEARTLEPPFRLPTGRGAVYLESGDRVDGLIELTEGLVIVMRERPTEAGVTCHVYPWWRVEGVDLYDA